MLIESIRSNNDPKLDRRRVSLLRAYKRLMQGPSASLPNDSIDAVRVSEHQFGIGGSKGRYETESGCSIF